MRAKHWRLGLRVGFAMLRDIPEARSPIPRSEAKLAKINPVTLISFYKGAMSEMPLHETMAHWRRRGSSGPRIQSMTDRSNPNRWRR